MGSFQRTEFSLYQIHHSQAEAFFSADPTQSSATDERLTNIVVGNADLFNRTGHDIPEDNHKSRPT
jgi:hypothetical protein